MSPPAHAGTRQTPQWILYDQIYRHRPGRHPARSAGRPPQRNFSFSRAPFGVRHSFRPRQRQAVRQPEKAVLSRLGKDDFHLRKRRARAARRQNALSQRPARRPHQGHSRRRQADGGSVSHPLRSGQRLHRKQGGAFPYPSERPLFQLYRAAKPRRGDRTGTRMQNFRL